MKNTVPHALLHSDGRTAGIILHLAITYSICPFPYMLSPFDKPYLHDLDHWNNHWHGPRKAQYGSVTFLCTPRGVFVVHRAPAPTPIPLMPRQGLMGTSVTSNNSRVNTNTSVCYHNLLCWLRALPHVQVMVGPCCISSMGVEGTLNTNAAKDEVKNHHVSVSTFLSASLPLCASRYTVKIREIKDLMRNTEVVLWNPDNPCLCWKRWGHLESGTWIMLPITQPTSRPALLFSATSSACTASRLCCSMSTGGILPCTNICTS